VKEELQADVDVVKTYYVPAQIEQLNVRACGVDLTTVRTPDVVGYLFVYEDRAKAEAAHPGASIIKLRSGQ